MKIPGTTRHVYAPCQARARAARTVAEPPAIDRRQPVTGDRPRRTLGWVLGAKLARADAVGSGHALRVDPVSDADFMAAKSALTHLLPRIDAAREFELRAAFRTDAAVTPSAKDRRDKRAFDAQTLLSTVFYPQPGSDDQAVVCTGADSRPAGIMTMGTSPTHAYVTTIVTDADPRAAGAAERLVAHALDRSGTGVVRLSALNAASEHALQRLGFAPASDGVGLALIARHRSDLWQVAPDGRWLFVGPPRGSTPQSTACADDIATASR